MLKIVVIDDEEKLRSLIKSLIPTELGMRVVGEAPDGVEGFELCCKYKPQIVITDIRMPEMDGLALMAKLTQTLPSTKVIVISGYDEFAYAQKAIENGAVGYLLKPIEEEGLYSVLQKAKETIEQRQKEKQHFEKMKLELNKLQDGLSSAVDEAEVPPANSNSPVIQKVLEYIHTNYNRDISLEEISSKMYMSSSYLSRLFREKTGKRFRDYLTEVRMNQAKLLLERPEFRVNEIADMLGYRDVSYFISIFKKHTGMTPNDYRCRNR